MMRGCALVMLKKTESNNASKLPINILCQQRKKVYQRLEEGRGLGICIRTIHQDSSINTAESHNIMNFVIEAEV